MLSVQKEMAVASPEVIPPGDAVRTAITNNWGRLMGEIDPGEMLLGKLIQYKVLESDDECRIKAMPSPQSQVSKMLLIVQTKGDAALQIFAHVVREEQPHLKLEELVQSADEGPSASYSLTNGRYYAQ